MAIDIIGTWCVGVPLCLIAAYVFKWGIAGVYVTYNRRNIQADCVTGYF